MDSLKRQSKCFTNVNGNILIQKYEFHSPFAISYCNNFPTTTMYNEFTFAYLRNEFMKKGSILLDSVIPVRPTVNQKTKNNTINAVFRTCIKRNTMKFEIQLDGLCFEKKGIKNIKNRILGTHYMN